MTYFPTTFGVISAAFLGLSACQMETVQNAAQDAPKAPAQATSTPQPAATRTAPTEEFQIPELTGRYVPAGFSWKKRNQVSSRLIFLGTAINHNGQTAICGIRAVRGHDTRQFNGQVANKFNFVIGDQIVLRNMYFFTQARSFDDIGTTKPTCRTTGVPWRPEFAEAPWDLDYNGPNVFEL